VKLSFNYMEMKILITAKK